MAKQKYYVVWKGRRPGLYDNWAECAAQVNGLPAAEYKAFESLAAAQKAQRESYNQHAGKAPAKPRQQKMALSGPRTPSISVDAACSGVPGPVEWRGVETESGRELFKFGPYLDGTNNLGEFLAIVASLQWLAKKKLPWPVYSDSRNAKLWVNAKKSRSKLARTGRNAELFELVSAAEAWLVRNDPPNEILKWDTKMWGENPADFGRK